MLETIRQVFFRLVFTKIVWYALDLHVAAFTALVIREFMPGSDPQFPSRKPGITLLMKAYRAGWSVEDGNGFHGERIT